MTRKRLPSSASSLPSGFVDLLGEVKLHIQIAEKSPQAVAKLQPEDSFRRGHACPNKKRMTKNPTILAKTREKLLPRLLSGALST